MHTLLPIDAAALPRNLVLEPPMTDAEFEEFCRLNDVTHIERSREGVIRMNAPAGSGTSDGNAEIVTQLRGWWKTHRGGRVYDSSAGFYLPDSSLLSPDASYLTAETLAKLTREERKGFPHVCPDFVIELLSETDRLAAARKKMELWIENGARLGWLVDPDKQRVLVYESGGESPAIVSGDAVQGSGPVEGFCLNLAEVWDCY